MKSHIAEFCKLEANLGRLQSHYPDLPVAGVLLSRLLLHLGRGMCSLLNAELKPLGLTEVEFRVLTTLFAQPDGVACPSELCASTSQSPANMSRISDSLVRRGLITRIARLDDRRKMDLRISPPGEDVVRRLLPVLHAQLRFMFKDFSDDQQLHLVNELKGLALTLDVALSTAAAPNTA